MSNGNPNVVILNSAWALLWNSQSSYYLPTILQNGGTFGSTTIPPLSQIAVPSPPSIPLYTSDTWGDVGITLSSLQLAGLPSIENQSFTPAPDASSVTAVVAFNQLTFSGDYSVRGSGARGCAMDLAEYSLTPGNTSGATAPPGSNMDLAREYRRQLTQNDNGLQLVSTYYDHNDTINSILRQNNAFTAAWPNAEPTGKGRNSQYYAGVTANAASNPDDQNAEVGDSDYQTHSYYMQGILIGTAFYYAGNNSHPDNRYNALANSISTFKGYTQQYTQPMTVDAVVTAVQTTQPQTAGELAARPEPELVRKAREMAERDFPMWHERAMAAEAERLFQTTTYESSGSFSFNFPMPTLTFTGTVAVSGTPPQETLTVTLTQLSATVPNIDIQLLTGTDPAFTQDVQTQINSAGWFQKVLGAQVNQQLGSPSVLSYVSNLFNQAIASLL